MCRCHLVCAADQDWVDRFPKKGQPALRCFHGPDRHARQERLARMGEEKGWNHAALSFEVQLHAGDLGQTMIAVTVSLALVAAC
jgi:hypothetical protein